MRTRLLALALILALTAPAVTAQGTQAGPPDRAGNVMLDLVITDTYSQTPTTKTVSMVIASGANGLIRTMNRLPNNHELSLNVDAQIQPLRGGQFRLNLTIEYTPPQTSGDTQAQTRSPAQLHQSLSVILDNGKPLTISQSADPVTDRKVSVEVTATLLQ
jgi:hypothetical protein